jgi:branched-chain amino acid transport system ATP-binding protein
MDKMKKIRLETEDRPLTTILRVQNLTVHYGTVQALNNISLEVQRGEIVAMIGPNGAGKSTALKAICGLLKATDGEIKTGDIIFNGKSIKNVPTYELVKKGLCLVPEDRRVFPSMSVKENLEMGAYTVVSDWLSDIRKLKTKNKQLKTRLEMVFNLFPVLKERQKQKAGTLSSGEQQMLAMGRALMLEPELLLLDEPSLGLSPNYVEIVFEKIKEINENGTTILLVEQNARMALEYSHRAYVFKIGEIAFSDKTEVLLQNDQIKKSFLGG